jgi:hypothetical protein
MSENLFIFSPDKQEFFSRMMTDRCASLGEIASKKREECANLQEGVYTMQNTLEVVRMRVVGRGCLHYANYLTKFTALKSK